MSSHLLDNIAWHSLTGHHARYAAGTLAARRYARGFAPVAGFADLSRPDLQALHSHCQPGEAIHCVGWSGAVPGGWCIEAETSMHKMLWQAAMPDEDPSFTAVLLGSAHVAQLRELVAIVPAGPFGIRMLELGEYWGCFHGQRLVAMAGERLRAGAFREISGVRTHPAFQGKGLARRLVQRLIRLEMLRDEIPFLQVKENNGVARRMYERMGFRSVQVAVARVLARCH